MRIPEDIEEMIPYIAIQRILSYAQALDWGLRHPLLAIIFVALINCDIISHGFQFSFTSYPAFFINDGKRETFVAHFASRMGNGLASLGKEAAE